MARRSRAKRLVQIAEETEQIYYAGFYGRISVEDGDDQELNSIGNQIKIGQFFLSEHSDIKLVDIYTDNGYTGMNYFRPDFKRMISDLQSGRINCVLVKDISRLGRHFVLTSEFVERIFPDMNVRLISINDEYDSIDEYADAIALTMPLKMVMNDYYVKDTSRKIRSSITTKMENGEFLPATGSIPYGYQRNPDKNTFDIDPDSAPVVRRIYEMRASGMKFNAIARELNHDGIPSPGRLRYLRGITKDSRFATAEWIRGTICKITNDPAYTGCRVHGKVKRDKVTSEKKRREPNQWLVIEQAHKPIVSQTLFDEVQRVNNEELEHRSTFEKRADVGADYRDVLRGKLICGDCGSTMVASKGCARPNAKTPSRVFYDCNGYKYSNHARCSSHYIRQETVLHALSTLFDQQVAMCVDVDKLLHEAKAVSISTPYRNGELDEYASISAKKRNTEAKIEHLLLDLADGIISRDEYLYMKQRLVQQLDVLSAEENCLHAEAKRLEAVIATAQSWLEAIQRYKRIPRIDRNLIEALVDRIEVFEDRHLRIILNYADPFQPIQEYLEEMRAVRHVG